MRKPTKAYLFNSSMRQILEHCTVGELIHSLQQCPPETVASMDGMWPGIAIHVTMGNSAVSLDTVPLVQYYDSFSEVLLP